jgi:rRNA maturation endonuclease Nob1
VSAHVDTLREALAELRGNGDVRFRHHSAEAHTDALAALDALVAGLKDAEERAEKREFEIRLECERDALEESERLAARVEQLEREIEALRRYRERTEGLPAGTLSPAPVDTPKECPTCGTPTVTTAAGRRICGGNCPDDTLRAPVVTDAADKFRCRGCGVGIAEGSLKWPYRCPSCGREHPRSEFVAVVTDAAEKCETCGHQRAQHPNDWDCAVSTCNCFAFRPAVTGTEREAGE